MPGFAWRLWQLRGRQPLRAARPIALDNPAQQTETMLRDPGWPSCAERAALGEPATRERSVPAHDDRRAARCRRARGAAALDTRLADDPSTRERPIAAGRMATASSRASASRSPMATTAPVRACRQRRRLCAALLPRPAGDYSAPARSATPAPPAVFTTRRRTTTGPGIRRSAAASGTAAELGTAAGHGGKRQDRLLGPGPGAGSSRSGAVDAERREFPAAGRSRG